MRQLDQEEDIIPKLEEEEEEEDNIIMHNNITSINNCNSNPEVNNAIETYLNHDSSTNVQNHKAGIFIFKEIRNSKYKYIK